MSFDAVMPPYNASDPSATFFNASCLDFLLIELVPLAYRVTNELEARARARVLTVPGEAVDEKQQQQQAGPDAAGAPQQPQQPLQPSSSQQQQQPVQTTGGPPPPPASITGGTTTGTRRLLDEDEERDAVFFRLDALGYRVGQGLVERFSCDRPRFHDTLDVIKFLCKDLWTLAFRKQVDNLKTNHRGVYVLTDHSFRPFQRMSTEAGGQAVVRAQPFLWFPCGIVRGALAALGITATVQAETSELPGAIFQIKTVPAKAQ
ncbi:bet3 family protein [Niveomyces insectorum RCEF 264]|uniref:Bet3 family protein n=1 Tax=Niveomyces insectorum RCEF 264 TaxID=1081102 RepID=A0A167QRH3_9HYPO|nr:bet3 family protein [Niveomyces insectorum RCEF 264]